MSRAKVGRDHESVSRDGLAAVAEWEAEHGALSEAELDAARKRVFGARRRKARRASTLSR